MNTSKEHIKTNTTKILSKPIKTYQNEDIKTYQGLTSKFHGIRATRAVGTIGFGGSTASLRALGTAAEARPMAWVAPWGGS